MSDNTKTPTENEITNKEIADALEILTISDAFAGNKMACNLFNMASARLREHNKPSIEEIEHIAGEMSQQDWNDLRFQDVYYEAFIEGAKFFNI